MHHESAGATSTFFLSMQYVNKVAFDNIMVCSLVFDINFLINRDGLISNKQGDILKTDVAKTWMHERIHTHLHSQKSPHLRTAICYMILHLEYY